MSSEPRCSLLRRSPSRAANSRWAPGGAGADHVHVHVQSAELNGQPLTKPELHHNDRKVGGTLHFKMGADPSDWRKEG